MTGCGQGYVTQYGYRRIHVPGQRRLRMEHVVVWEDHDGPVPPGMETETTETAPAEATGAEEGEA